MTERQTAVLMAFGFALGILLSAAYSQGSRKTAVPVPDTVASVRTVEVDGCKYVVATGGAHGVCIVHAGDCRNVLGHVGRNPLR